MCWDNSNILVNILRSRPMLQMENNYYLSVIKCMLLRYGHEGKERIIIWWQRLCAGVVPEHSKAQLKPDTKGQNKHGSGSHHPCCGLDINRFPYNILTISPFASYSSPLCLQRLHVTSMVWILRCFCEFIHSTWSILIPPPPKPSLYLSFCEICLFADSLKDNEK